MAVLVVVVVVVLVLVLVWGVVAKGRKPYLNAEEYQYQPGYLIVRAESIMTVPCRFLTAKARNRPDQPTGSLPARAFPKPAPIRRHPFL